MIRHLRAFAWLRWRLLLNGVRGSRRRDTLEQVSRLLALIAPAAIVVLSLGSVIALSLAGFFGGRALARGEFAPDVLVMIARALLMAATLLVVFLPIGMAAQTSAARYTRLLLLPIPARVLHFVEVVAGLADPWIAFMLPGLALFALGLVTAGRWDGAALAALAGIGVAAVLVSMSALVGFLMSWLMRDRRRAELVTLLFVVGISAVAVLPQLLDTERRENRAEGRRGEPVSIARVEAALPVWTRALPSEMYGQVLTTGIVERRAGPAVLWLGGLFLQAALLYGLSGVVHRRLIDSAGTESGRRRRNAEVRPLVRLPGVSAATSAVAVAQMMTGLRSVRGRLAVLLPGPMIALVALMVTRAPEEGTWTASIGEYGHLVFGASLIFAIYAAQPFSLNQFTSDRAGLTLQLLMPVSTVELVRGKALGCTGLVLVAGLLAAVATSISTGGGPWVIWLSVALGGLATFVAVTPLAALLSAAFPVAADLSKSGSGGNPHAFSLLVGSALVLAAALPPLVLFVVGQRFGPGVTVAASVVWLVVVTMAAVPLLSLVARVVESRRENLFLVK